MNVAHKVLFSGFTATAGAIGIVSVSDAITGPQTKKFGNALLGASMLGFAGISTYALHSAGGANSALAAASVLTGAALGALILGQDD